MGKKIGFLGGKFLPLHNGHTCAILNASQQCDELHVFLFYNTVGEEELIKKSKFTHVFLSPKARKIVLESEFGSYKNIKIHTIDSSKCFNSADNGWDNESKEVVKAVGCEPNIIFTSEKSYEGNFKKSYPNAEIRYIDPERTLMNISGTIIRRDGEFKCWGMIPKAYKILCAKSVVFFGEGEKKRKLILDLNKIYQTTCVEMDNFNNERLKSEMFKVRLQADRVTFINAAEKHIDDYKVFYAEQNMLLYINEGQNKPDYLSQFNVVDIKGNYNEQFLECIRQIKHLIE